MRKLEPTSKTFTIEWPDDRYVSEFEVQAFVFSELRKLGIDVRGEVIHKITNAGGRGRVCRFDLVIFKNRTATAIVEIKGESSTGKPGANVNGRQLIRYREYGIPVFFVRGMEQAQDFIDRCKARKAKDAL